MEQNIGVLFVVIGLLVGTIGVLEKNYMPGIDNKVDKFNKKHNTNIDNATYYKFEAIHQLKYVAGLLILNAIYSLFEIKDVKTMLTLLFIYSAFDWSRYYIRRKQFINKLKSQY